jgi:hypothetical protein
MNEAEQYVEKIQAMTPEERKKEFPTQPLPGEVLTDAQVDEINKQRIAANNRRKAQEFAAEIAQEDAEWTVAVNQFIAARSTSEAINNDQVKIRWNEANIHTIVSKAKQLGLRPSVGSLDFIFGQEQASLCAHLEDELTEEEKSKIITRHLVQQKKLAPRYLRDNRGQTIPDSPEDMLERAGYTQEEWDAAASHPRVQESFRRNALTKGYSRLTDLSISHIAPQRAKLPTLDTNQLPPHILAITKNDLFNANSEQLKKWYQVEGAREYFAEVLARWRRGERA